MAQLRRDYDKFLDRNAEVVVVGPEGQDKFEDYFTEHDLPFTGLPDPDHSVLKMYGQEIKIFKFGRMPAQVIIDRDGIARYVHYGHGMEDIPPNEEILAVLEELEKETEPV
jgi:peroxiredoxin Q/BCP